MARVAVADVIADRMRVAMGNALADRQDELTKIAQAGGREAANDLLGKADQLVSLVFDLAALAAAGDPPAEAALLTARELAGGGGNLGHQWLWAYVIYEVLIPLVKPFELPLMHAANAAVTNEIHPPDQAAELVARGLFTDAHGRDEAAGSGFDTDHFERMVSLATQRPDVGTALELLRRGALSDSFVEGELRHLGYADQTVEALMTLRRVLLSPADLALARLRGNIDENTMQGYAQRLGIDTADMDLLVENTGEPPGLMELLFAYRRGFIDQARLERGIRQSRVRNEWIDVVEKLRFSPMSTESAVRAVVENYITPAHGQQIAEQNGLEPEHFPILHESWGRPLAHMEMASLVHRGLASRAQFDQAMRESDLKDKYINQSYEVATKLPPERMIVQAIQHKAITLKEGSKLLLQLGYSPESVSVMLKLGLSEQHTTAHALTRAQITTLYSDGILSRAQATQHLEALGHTAADAGYMLQIVDVQTHAKEVRAEVSATRTSYLAGGVNAAHAETELRNAGVPIAQAQHLLGVWNREKRRAARSLTETQIVKAAKAGTYTPDQAITTLEAIGYSRADAATLLRSNGVNTGA